MSSVAVEPPPATVTSEEPALFVFATIVKVDEPTIATALLARETDPGWPSVTVVAVDPVPMTTPPEEAALMTWPPPSKVV